MFSSALKSFTSNITANYAVSTTPSFLSGAWKVYDGKNKKTGKAVSVFVFDRKSLEPQFGGIRSKSEVAGMRKIHDEVVERLKKEASSLARLRHPSILQLEEPVEDTRSGGLIFATEPIITSLSNLLQDEDGHDGSGGRQRGSSRSKVDGDGGQTPADIDELEIQKGLLQVAKGLEFLHESAGLVHGNVTPDAIYINQKSDWKISGLGFSGPPDTAPSTSAASAPIALSELLYHDPRLPHNVQLNIDYTSPDFVLDSNITASADMFSLGLLVIALYNSPHESPLHANANVSAYKKLFSSSSTVPSSSNNFLSKKPLPRDLLGEVLPRLITRRPAQRMAAREFQQSRFFENILVSTLRFLDSLPAKTPNEKMQFLRGLPRILDQFPKSVLEKKVLLALLEETKDRDLLALILQNVFKIIKIVPSIQRSFVDKVLPHLRETFLESGGKPERDPAKDAGLNVVLENIELIASNCSGKEFKDDVLPIIHLAMDSHTPSLVDKSLGCLPTILSTLDFSTIKNEVFPIIAAVFTKTNSLTIKIRGLEAFSLLCGARQTPNTGSKPIFSAILDKYTVQEKVVPLLKAIKTKEPQVMMAVLAVFKQVGRIADSDYLAVDVLPILWTFSLGPLLNLEQFAEFMSLIKAISSRIEEEQSRKLRELSSNSANGFNGRRSNDLMTPSPLDDSFGGAGVGEDDFERLVLGKSSGSASNDLLGPTSRPAPQRAVSAQQSTATSSWPNPSQNTNSLQGLQAQSSFTQRTITPDQSLRSFATLAPTQPVSPMQPIAPTSPWGTMQPLQPRQPSQPKTNPPNAWSSNIQQQPIRNSSTSSWGVPPPPPTSLQSSGWNLQPPPSGQQNAWSRNETTNGNAANGVGGSLFSIPPPGGGKGQASGKTGLDKYESLI